MDFVQVKRLPSPKSTLWDQVALGNGVRLSQAGWRDLMPDRIEGFTTDGQQVAFDSLEELGAWCERRHPSSIKTLFVRWTTDGRPAGEGVQRLALRLGDDATMWVGGADEASVIGMADLVVRALGPRDLPDALQSGARATGLLRASTVSGAYATRAGRFLHNPWLVTIGGGVVGGVVLLWIGSRFF